MCRMDSVCGGILREWSRQGEGWGAVWLYMFLLVLGVSRSSSYFEKLMLILGCVLLYESNCCGTGFFCFCFFVNLYYLWQWSLLRNTYLNG